MTIAEMLCQRCGAVSHSDVRSRHREPASALCACGGLRQTVRIHHIPMTPAASSRLGRYAPEAARPPRA